MRRWVVLAGMVLVAGLAPHARGEDSPAADVPGSHDHPVVSRFAGSRIVGYQQVAYDQATLPLGPYRPANHALDKSQTLAGRVTRIAYAVPPGKSTLEVYRNFAQALEEAGFAMRFACAGQTCGDGAAFSDHIISPLLDKMGHGARNTMVQTLYAVDGDIRALTAHLDRSGGAVDVSLLVSRQESARDLGPLGVLLQVVEAKPMAQGQVTVNAKAMGRGLAQAGHIALYGIRFTSDSAVLDGSSDATLAQMAALLKTQPALKAFVVGHTDNSGSLTHNLRLSQQRAQAVVRALTGRYGVAATRLAAKGLASYAPVASNRDDAGRARNRRVELVEQ